MTTEAEALQEVREASVMTAWVMDLIEPLPGRSRLASLTKCYGMNSAYGETHMLVFTVILPKQFKDLINCGRFMMGNKGQPRYFFVKTPEVCQPQLFLKLNLSIPVTSVLVLMLSNL